MIKINIPGLPVGKGRPRASTIGGKARLYTPKKTADYEKVVQILAHVVMGGLAPSSAPMSAEIWVMAPIPKSFNKTKTRMALEGDIRPVTKPDLDNVAKIILDSLNGICYEDDRQVTDMVIRRRYSADPCVLVYLEEVVL
jgi:Holliday junction resolvase RusA-like endonuclease